MESEARKITIEACDLVLDTLDEFFASKEMTIQDYCNISVSVVISFILTILTKLETNYRELVGDQVSRRKLFNEIVLTVNKHFNMH